jgi:hypothetical protein
MYGRYLPNAFQIIIHLSSSHSTLYVESVLRTSKKNNYDIHAISLY